GPAGRVHAARPDRRVDQRSPPAPPPARSSPGASARGGHGPAGALGSLLWPGPHTDRHRAGKGAAIPSTPCWCGETEGPPVGSHYRRCARCGTAVVSVLPAGLACDPCQDDGLYGKDYWLSHQRDHGLPDVTLRARTDPTERCVFWLERLLESVRPPGRALEL